MRRLIPTLLIVLNACTGKAPSQSVDTDSSSNGIESVTIVEGDGYLKVRRRNDMLELSERLSRDGVKHLVLENLGLVLFTESIDDFIGDDYFVGKVHVVDFRDKGEEHIFPAWIDDRVDTILVGECDSIVYVFSNGGSSSIATMSRINLTALKESYCQTIEPAFQLDKMVDDGFEGTCFHRAQDIGIEKAGYYKTKFDFRGELLYHVKMEE